MEGIERPVMKALEEEKEAENRRDTETRRKEPTGLSERIDEKNRHKDSNGTRKRNGIVGSDSNETCEFKLSKHEPYKCKCTVESHKSPESPKLDPADEISLSFRAP